MKSSNRTLALALALALGLALACAAVGAHAQGYSKAAQAVLARARAASGGSGWNFLRGWHETGKEGGAAFESWFDPLRLGMRVETRDAAGLHVRGFNGQGEWRILPGGATTGGGERGPVAEARADAFFGVYGFFYPGRFDAQGEYVGVRQAGGRSFEVLKVKPWNGQPRELWFDRKTHLLARMVDPSGAKPVVVELSDYRKVGPVRVAFHYAVEGGEARQVESLVFAPADREMFSLPRSLGGGK